MIDSRLMVEGSCTSHLSMHTERQEGMGAKGGYSSQASHNRTTGMATMGMHLSSIAENSIRAALGAGVGVHPGGGMLAGAEAEASNPS